MSLVKVTRKRQITLPKKICDKLGISPGDYVRIYLSESKIIVEKTLGLRDLKGLLNPGKTLDGLAEKLDRERREGER